MNLRTFNSRTFHIIMILTAGLCILWFGLNFILTQWCIEPTLRISWRKLKLVPGKLLKCAGENATIVIMHWNEQATWDSSWNRIVEVLKCIMEPIWFYNAGFWKYLKCTAEKLETKDVVQMGCESTGGKMSFLVKEILESVIMRNADLEGIY